MNVFFVWIIEANLDKSGPRFLKFLKTLLLIQCLDAYGAIRGVA